MTKKKQVVEYIKIEQWMCSREGLGLTGVTLSLFAWIYGYSQVNKDFYASIDFAANWLGVSEPTIVAGLQKLVKLGLVTKTAFTTTTTRMRGYKYTIDNVKVNTLKNIFDLKVSETV